MARLTLISLFQVTTIFNILLLIAVALVLKKTPTSLNRNHQFVELGTKEVVVLLRDALNVVNSQLVH